MHIDSKPSFSRQQSNLLPAYDGPTKRADLLPSCMCAVEEVLQLSSSLALSLVSCRPVRSGWRFVTPSPIGNPPAFQIPWRDPKLYLISLSHCPLKLSKDPNGCRCFVLFHENLDSPSGRVLRRPYRRIWGPVANFTPQTHVGLVRLPQYLYYRCNGSVAAIPRARILFATAQRVKVACPVLISFAPGAALCLLVVSLARPQKERQTFVFSNPQNAHASHMLLSAPEVHASGHLAMRADFRMLTQGGGIQLTLEGSGRESSFRPCRHISRLSPGELKTTFSLKLANMVRSLGRDILSFVTISWRDRNIQRTGSV